MDVFRVGEATAWIWAHLTPKSSSFDQCEHSRSVLGHVCHVHREMVCSKWGNNGAQTRKWAAVYPLCPLCYTVDAEVGKSARWSLSKVPKKKKKINFMSHIYTVRFVLCFLLSCSSRYILVLIFGAVYTSCLRFRPEAFYLWVKLPVDAQQKHMSYRSTVYKAYLSVLFWFLSPFLYDFYGMGGLVS